MIVAAGATTERRAAGGIGGGDTREDGKCRSDAPRLRYLTLAGDELSNLERLLGVVEAGARVCAIAGLGAAAPRRHRRPPNSSAGSGPAIVIASRLSSQTTGGRSRPSRRTSRSETSESPAWLPVQASTWSASRSSWSRQRASWSGTSPG